MLHLISRLNALRHTPTPTPTPSTGMKARRMKTFSRLQVGQEISERKFRPRKVEEGRTHARKKIS